MTLSNFGPKKKAPPQMPPRRGLVVVGRCDPLPKGSYVSKPGGHTSLEAVAEKKGVRAAFDAFVKACSAISRVVPKETERDRMERVFLNVAKAYDLMQKLSARSKTPAADAVTTALCIALDAFQKGLSDLESVAASCAGDRSLDASGSVANSNDGKVRDADGYFVATGNQPRGMMPEAIADQMRARRRVERGESDREDDEQMAGAGISYEIFKNFFEEFTEVKNQPPTIEQAAAFAIAASLELGFSADAGLSNERACARLNQHTWHETAVQRARLRFRSRFGEIAKRERTAA